MTDVQRIGLDEVVRHFEELEDPRSEVNLRHPLVSVVVIALLAVLAGAGGPTAIARWAVMKREFLLQVLDLPNGIPSKDVFRRVLMALRPGAFQACFASGCNRCAPRRSRRPESSNPFWRWTARRHGGATIARTAWALCIRSVSGPASTACRWGRWLALRNRTRSRQFPSF